MTYAHRELLRSRTTSAKSATTSAKESQVNKQTHVAGDGMEWLPIETAPKDGASLLVPPDGGYTHAFWEDGFWWWYASDKGYAAGPAPKGWLPLLSAPKEPK